MGTILSLIMFCCSPLIARYFDMPSLSLIVKVMSGTFIIKALEGLQNALMKKRLDFKTPFKINLTSGIITAVLGITLAFTGFGVWSLVIMQIAGWVLTTIQIWLYNSWRPTLEFDLKSVSSLWKFGYKYSLAVTIDSIFCKLDTLIIGRLFKAATLGLFYRAQSLNKLVVQYSFSSISTVLFPAISKIKDDPEKVSQTIIQLLHIVSFLTFVFAGLMYVCSKEVIVILYTDKWLGAVPFFKILGLFTFCTTIPNVLVSPLNSLGHSGKNLRIEIIKKTLLLCAIPFGIHFGLYSYIIAVNMAATIGILLNMQALKCVALTVSKQVRVLFQYMLPFAILVTVFEITFRSIDFNIYIMLFAKAILYFSIYVLYNRIFNTRGFEIALNSLLLPVVNKLLKIHK